MVDMQGKTVLITGGTDGLGKEAAIKLATMGATVLVTGRDRNKGEAVVRKLQREHDTDAGELFIADFASQSAVCHLAEKVAARYDRLDVLINNAGLGLTERTLTDAGIEMTFAVNYLASFLLTHCLLPQLRAAESGRIINVSSGLHYDGTIDFDDLHGTQDYDGWEAYRQSKLAIVLFTYELADRLQGTEITANCLEPGPIPGTNLSRGFPWYLRVAFGVWSRLPERFVRTPENGAETYVYLATSPEVATVTGKYFADEQPKQSAPLSYDTEMQERLWNLSADRAGLSSTVELDAATDHM